MLPHRFFYTSFVPYKKESCSLKIIPFCRVLTLYYKREVIFSVSQLEEQNEDGVSILFYLQKIFLVFFFFGFQMFILCAWSLFFTF